MSWLTSFSDKELFAPFSVREDSDYYNDLRKRYTHLIKLLESAGADEKCIGIVKKYSDKVCEAIRDYYKGNISTCHQKIQNLVKKSSDNKLALSSLNESIAFPGGKNEEIQLFRARVSNTAADYTPRDMLHLPYKLRAKTGNYRFSIPGIACLYLANSSYGCWIEMGRPSEHDFYVAPAVLDGSQKIFNLAVMSRDLAHVNDTERVHCWLRLLVLMIATSYKVEENGRSFKSEYIVSQSIMLACKTLGYDGVAYFSKRVFDERFALVAINLALFADYRRGKEYGEICSHLKIDYAMNYQMYRQLNSAAKLRKYKLRVANTPYITNIKDNQRNQYSYKDTEFFLFDKHLFAQWEDKDSLAWGNALI